MRRVTILVLALASFAIACGDATPPPAAPAPPAATTASAPPPATKAAGDGSCFAMLSDKKPAGWTEVGKLVIEVKDEMPVGYAVHDASGAKVDSGPVDVKGARAAGNVIAQKACKVGGVVVVYEGKPEKDGPMTAIIMKPAKEDEPGDLATMCKQPTEVTADLDAMQKRRLAVAVFETRLTSPKWRAWLFDMSKKLVNADDGARSTIMGGKADELDAAAKVKDCWFSGALRKK